MGLVSAASAPSAARGPRYSAPFACFLINLAFIWETVLYFNRNGGGRFNKCLQSGGRAWYDVEQRCVQHVQVQRWWFTRHAAGATLLPITISFRELNGFMLM